MKFEVNVEKRHFLGLVVLGAFLIGVVGVVAYNSAGIGGVPADFGHSGDEIEVMFGGEMRPLNAVLGELSAGSGGGVASPWTVVSSSKIRYDNFVEIGSNLRVEGARMYLDGEDANGIFWMMAGGNTEGTDNAFGFYPDDKSIWVGTGWGLYVPDSQLHVGGSVPIYKKAAGCTLPSSLTTESTCASASCGFNAWNDCAGNCKSYAGSTQDTCNNQLIGNLLPA